jgi:hypothetical protein
MIYMTGMNSVSGVSLLPTREEFYEWLKLHEREYPIGIRCSTKYCPVASYLNQTHRSVSVNQNTIRVGNYHMDTPVWLSKFIHQIDNVTDEEYAGWLPHDRRMLVTAREAVLTMKNLDDWS